MSYTLNEAAKAVGKSKTTIHRAIKSGKISASKLESGAYEIDPSELHRVFQIGTAERATLNTTENSNIEQLKSALAIAEARADAAETLAQERAERIEDLRRMLPPPNAARRTIWQWPWRK